MNKREIEILKIGGVGVVPTDTIYGLLGSAFSPMTVERIYTLKGRDETKPFIILISSLDELKRFSIVLSKAQKKYLKRVWPGPVSVVFFVVGDKFSYLHRGHNSLAFRLPNNKRMLNLLAKTGPLVAPSANPQGMFPAKTAIDAKHYFADGVDFYEDGGRVVGEPSAVIKVGEDGKVTVIRPSRVFFSIRNDTIFTRLKIIISKQIKNVLANKNMIDNKIEYKTTANSGKKKIVVVAVLLVLVLLAGWFVFKSMEKKPIETEGVKMSTQQVEAILSELNKSNDGKSLTQSEAKNILKEMESTSTPKMTPDQVRALLQ